jgi:hypothetical protein
MATLTLGDAKKKIENPTNYGSVTTAKVLLLLLAEAIDRRGPNWPVS